MNSVPRSALKDSLAPGRAPRSRGRPVAFRVVDSGLPLVLLLTMSWMAAPLAAQGDRWEQQVARGLDRTTQSLNARGYRAAGARVSGLLFVDESTRLEMPVSGTAEYLLVGTCDDDCSGLSLVISNPTGYEVDAARGPGNAPIVKVDPPMLPGMYRITVTMAGCRVSPCRYGVATYVRRLPRPAEQ